MEFKKAAINACNALRIKKGEKVVIVTDLAKEFFAKEVAQETIKRGASLSYFVMEHYGKRPYKVPDVILDVCKNSDAGFVMWEAKKGEYPIFRKPIFDIPQKTKKLRLATMPDITKEILNDAMLADFNKVDEFSRRVYDLLKRAKEVQIKTSKGTNLVALVGKYNWVKSTGLIKSGTWGNLPSGEVYTTPYFISGKAVVDWFVCGYIDQKCESTSVKMEIKDSRIISVSCKNKNLQRKIVDDIHKDKKASRIGEIALGTNIYIKKLIGQGLQDEKYPGVHFANGDPIGEKTGAKWDSKTHTDYILRYATVLVDGKKIMDKGKYLIK